MGEAALAWLYNSDCTEALANRGPVEAPGLLGLCRRAQIAMAVARLSRLPGGIEERRDHSRPRTRRCSQRTGSSPLSFEALDARVSLQGEEV